MPPMLRQLSIMPSFYTVNSETFVRVYFCQTSLLLEITLFITDIGKSCPSRKILASQVCLLMLFAKKSSRTVEITLSITVIGQSSSSHEILTSQVCLLMLFTKTKFSRKFPGLTVANCSHRQGYGKFKDFSKIS